MLEAQNKQLPARTCAAAVLSTPEVGHGLLKRLGLAFRWCV